MSNLLEVDSCFNCTICFGLLEKPKMLPSCGHCFCYKCLTQLLLTSQPKTEMKCPECRTLSPVGVGGVEAFQTNFAIQKAVEFLKANSKFSPNDRGCIHAKLMKHPSKCSHCQADFCIGCAKTHAEERKIESLWIGSGLNDRLNKLRKQIDMKKVEKALEKQVKELEEEINRELAEMEQNVLKVMKNEREKLVERVHLAANQKMQQFKTFEDLVEKYDATRIQSDLNELSNVSVLNLELNDVAQMHKQFFKINDQLGKFENEIGENGEIGICVAKTRPVKMSIENLGKYDRNWFSWDVKPPHVNCQSDPTRLSQAIQSSDFKAAAQIVSRKSIPEVAKNYIVNIKTSNLFILAAAAGATAAVKALCPNDIKRCTEALRQATINNHLPVAKYLINRFPDIVEKCQEENICLIDLACEHGHGDIVKFMCGREQSPFEKWRLRGNFRNVIEKGHLEVVRVLLKSCPELVNLKQGVDRCAALHVASLSGHLNIVKELIEKYRADVNVTDQYGDTPLHAALRHPQIVEYLARIEGLVLKKNDKGNFPLEMAKYLLREKPADSAKQLRKSIKILEALQTY